ncbi:hypothetical protein JOM56_013958 [Amanita muscaria]
MDFEHDHISSQDLSDITAQLHHVCRKNKLSQAGDHLWPFLIPSNGATGLTTTDQSAQSPSAAGPLVINLQADLKPVVSSQFQRAAGKRRKEGIYKCPFRNVGCNATFTAPHNLRYHVNSHQGLKPYKCGKCLYATTSPATMKRHQLNCKGKVSKDDPDESAFCSCTLYLLMLVLLVNILY